MKSREKQDVRGDTPGIEAFGEDDTPPAKNFAEASAGKDQPPAADDKPYYDDARTEEFFRALKAAFLSSFYAPPQREVKYDESVRALAAVTTPVLVEGGAKFGNIIAMPRKVEFVAPAPKDQDGASPFTADDAFRMAMLASKNKDMIEKGIKLSGTKEEKKLLRQAIESMNASLPKDQRLKIKGFQGVLGRMAKPFRSNAGEKYNSFLLQQTSAAPVQSAPASEKPQEAPDSWAEGDIIEEPMPAPQDVLRKDTPAAAPAAPSGEMNFDFDNASSEISEDVKPVSLDTLKDASPIPPHVYGGDAKQQAPAEKEGKSSKLFREFTDSALGAIPEKQLKKHLVEFCRDKGLSAEQAVSLALKACRSRAGLAGPSPAV